MKIVIPVAGLGTRLLPTTKEQPKEMLPVFCAARGKIYVKPLVQLVFEQLFDFGFREFCFIIGRGKRAIEDHFTSDPQYVSMLRKSEKEDLALELENFYKKLEESSIVWIDQPEPRGFGDAVSRSEPFIGDEEFLVHAGDTYIISKQKAHLHNLIKLHRDVNSQTTFVVQKVESPKQYGIIMGKKIEENIYKVDKVIEKPPKPPTNLAIMPIYIFHSDIFKALREITLGVGGELQLTDAIQKLIDWGNKVHAIELASDDLRLDIGTPETYWEALKLSYPQSPR